jgi:hypothetical protein
LAVIGMVVLAVAILTGSTVIALAAIVLAGVGLLLLARDWLKQRERSDMAGGAYFQPDERPAEEKVAHGDRLVNPDTFEPDVSYEEAIENAGEDEDFNVEDEGDSET